MLVLGPLLFWALQQVVRLSVTEIVSRVWRPIAAAAWMAVVVNLLHADWISAAPLRLLYDVTIGGITFPATLMLLWLTARRPPGIERSILDYLTRRARSGFRPKSAPFGS